MRKILLLAMLLLVPSVAVGQETPTPPTAGPTPTNGRRHYEIRDVDGTVQYEVTRVLQMTDERHLVAVLVLDVRQGKYIIEYETTFPQRISTRRFSDVTRKAFIATEAAYTGPGNTPQEAAAAKPTPGQQPAAPRVMRVTTAGGGEWNVSQERMKWSERRDLRTRLRQAVDPGLLETLERMRGTPLQTEVVPFARLLLHLGQDVEVNTTPVAMRPEVVAPDCGFDKSFGFPCTKEQEEKVHEAAKKREVLAIY